MVAGITYCHFLFLYRSSLDYCFIYRVRAWVCVCVWSKSVLCITNISKLHKRQHKAEQCRARSDFQQERYACNSINHGVDLTKGNTVPVLVFGIELHIILVPNKCRECWLKNLSRWPCVRTEKTEEERQRNKLIKGFFDAQGVPRWRYISTSIWSECFYLQKLDLVEEQKILRSTKETFDRGTSPCMGWQEGVHHAVF